MNEMDGRRRFSELLPWHINGTLEQSERAWVEDYLREHPDAQSELRWTEALQAKIRQAAGDVAPEAGLDRLMARVHAEAAGRRRAAAARTPAGIGERIRSFLAAWQLTPAVAVAATVIVAQTGVIGTLLMTEMDAHDQEFSTVRSIAPGQIVSGPVLQVSFRAETSERDLRALMVRVGGTLVGGPGQLGNYLISVPAGEIEQAAQLFAASGHVQDVAVLEHIPVRE